MATSLLNERPRVRDTQSREQSPPPANVRVLHVINGEHYSGAERVQDLLAAELDAHGFEVGFACLKSGQFAQQRQARKAPLYNLAMLGRFDLRPVLKLVRIIRREGYGLLHAHTPRSAMVAGIASALTGVPMVYHVHSPTSRDSTRRWRNRINALVERLSLRRASALIAVSKSLGRHACRQGFAADRVFVVANGVPCRQPAPTGDDSAGTWTVGTVALFRPRKGVEVLLQSLAILRLRGLPVRLLAIGGFETPEYERDIKKLAAELGLSDAVVWTGFTRDIDRELARMDMFVLPSLFGEGLPMVVLEAMSAGVPVVATRVEGTPEAIRDGRDGLIAEPGDARDLAAAIRRIVSGEVDRHALRASALRRQAAKFSEKSMAAGVAEVYRRVLENEPVECAG